MGKWPFRSSSVPVAVDNKIVADALESSRREGLRLTIQARTLILVVLALLFVTRIPWPESGYYLLFIAAFALVGWGQLLFARANYPNVAASALMLDAVILTYMLFAPNPWTELEWPTATIYKFSGWRYLFVFLAAATIGHSWRIVLLFGAWMAFVWLITAGVVSRFGKEMPEITVQLNHALESETLARVLDPNRIFWSARIADAVVLVLVALILAVNAWRRNKLVLSQAELARQHSNLSRHFAPTMVELLANRDRPFGDVRSQDVVIVFADLVGFTAFAERHEPEETIRLLSRYHEQLESIIFKHEGTLDKFLGDGVMASFGTPFVRDDDAERALRCVEEMAEIQLTDGLSISVGAHRGKVVLGDVGSERRLEFAIVGDTVNVASRLESSTRESGVRACVSDELMQTAEYAGNFVRAGSLVVRGRKEAIAVWRLK